ncbi:MAG: hypothetical protein K0R67_3948 [Paenibacillus sp.]|nr:hypothetical protein [Paenibacillus sp.]
MRLWHSFWISYNEALLDSCTCEKERARLSNKISYHRMKVYF